MLVDFDLASTVPNPSVNRTASKQRFCKFLPPFGLRLPVALPFLYCLLAGGISAQPYQAKEYRGLEFNEAKITTKVPYKAGFFSNEKLIEIHGILWMPVEGKFPTPYPMVIFNHGSQDGGTSMTFEPVTTKYFLEHGFAVLSPIRKGFSRSGEPPSDAHADTAEPIACGNAALSESGVKSAMSDVIALRQALTDRKELDLTKVVLAGQSRGGFLSLALAAQNFPGLVGVINFSGGWYSERCFAAFNAESFARFGQSIKVPVMSFYGDVDRYYSLSHIIHNLSFLDSSQSTYYVLPGGGHSSPRNNQQFWREPVTKLLEQITNPKAKDM